MIRSRRRRAAARSLVLLRLVQACTSCGRLEMISVWLLVLKLLVGTPMFFSPVASFTLRHWTRRHLEILYLEIQCAVQNISNVSKPNMVLWLALSFMIVSPAAELKAVLQIWYQYKVSQAYLDQQHPSGICTPVFQCQWSRADDDIYSNVFSPFLKFF